MRKIILSIFVAVMTASCSNNQHSGPVYNNLKTKPYAEMSSSERLTFTNGLSKKLGEDPHFEKMNEMYQNTANMWLSRDKSKDTHPPRRKAKTLQAQQEWIDYYRKRGVEDPALFLKRQKQFVALYARVRKKFPELSNLDAAARNRVLKEASSYPDLEMQFKSIAKGKRPVASRDTAFEITHRDESF